MSESIAAVPAAPVDTNASPEQGGGGTPGIGDRRGFKALPGNNGTLNAKATDTVKGNAAAPEKRLGVPTEKKPDAPAEKRKFSFTTKVDGKESVEEYDEDTLIRELQMAKAANKRMGEAAKQRKDAEALQKAFMDGDEAKLRELGLDPDEWAAKRLAERTRKMSMSPEQIEMERMRAENQQYRSQYERQQQDFESKAQEASDQRAWEELQPQFVEALKTRDLPADVATMQLIASVGLEFAEAGIDLSPAQVVAEVERRQGARIERYMVKTFKENPDHMVKFLTKHGLLDSVRGALDKAWQDKTGIKGAKKTVEETPKGPIKHNPDAAPMSEAEWLKSVRANDRKR